MHTDLIFWLDYKLTFFLNQSHSKMDLDFFSLLDQLSKNGYILYLMPTVVYKHCRGSSRTNKKFSAFDYGSAQMRRYVWLT